METAKDFALFQLGLMIGFLKSRGGMADDEIRGAVEAALGVPAKAGEAVANALEGVAEAVAEESKKESN